MDCMRVRARARACVCAERNARVQEQTLSLKRVGEDLVTMAQRMDAEKASR